MLKDYEEQKWKVWLFFILTGIVSVLGGILASRLNKFRIKRRIKAGKIILAGIGFTFLGHTFSIATINRVPYYQFSIMIFSAIFGILSAFMTPDTTTMFVTSFLGSYIIIRILTLFFGGFTNEWQILYEFQIFAVQWESFNRSFYACLSGIIMFTVFGWYY